MATIDRQGPALRLGRNARSGAARQLLEEAAVRPLGRMAGRVRTWRATQARRTAASPPETRVEAPARVAAEPAPTPSARDERMVLGTFTWMAPLSDEERAAVTFSPAREELADGDLYLDATSPKRGPTLAFDGEWVPAGGAYILRSKVDDALWERLVAAAAGTIR